MRSRSLLDTFASFVLAVGKSALPAAAQMSGIQSVSRPPNADELDQVDLSWRKLPSVIDRLNDRITTRTSAVRAQVCQANVHPEAAQPIRMPRR